MRCGFVDITSTWGGLLVYRVVQKTEATTFEGSHPLLTSSKRLNQFQCMIFGALLRRFILNTFWFQIHQIYRKLVTRILLLTTLGLYYIEEFSIECWAELIWTNCRIKSTAAVYWKMGRYWRPSTVILNTITAANFVLLHLICSDVRRKVTWLEANEIGGDISQMRFAAEQLDWDTLDRPSKYNDVHAVNL